MSQWEKAPRLVKMQAKREPLNEIIAKFNDWFLLNPSIDDMDEKTANELAGKRMMLMGLCHFGRLCMQPCEDGTRRYKSCQ